MMLKVLAVDDSPTMRGLLEQALLAAGFDAVLAVDGEDGLRQLQTADPDVVITDINMPRLDGFGFISALRKSHSRRDLPVLVLSTEGAAAQRDRARQAGATGWIVKPFDEDTLVKTIRLVAEKRD